MFRTVCMLAICALFSSGCSVCCRDSAGIFSYLAQSRCPSGQKEFDVKQEEECTSDSVCCSLGGGASFLGRATCADNGGRELPEAECEDGGDGGAGEGGGSGDGGSGDGGTGSGSGGSGGGGTGGGTSGGTCSCEEDGVTFSANEECTWEDQEECSGFHSACEFGSDGVDPDGELADGTSCTLEECTITIHCP
jgi:hypothetical protein